MNVNRDELSSRQTALSSRLAVNLQIHRPPISYCQVLQHKLIQNKQTPWPLVRKRTVPTERPRIC
jgi:hypothetical protein